MEFDAFKSDLDAVLGQAALALSADAFEELIAWLVNESGWM